MNKGISFVINSFIMLLIILPFFVNGASVSVNNEGYAETEALDAPSNSGFKGRTINLGDYNYVEGAVHVKIVSEGCIQVKDFRLVGADGGEYSASDKNEIICYNSPDHTPQAVIYPNAGGMSVSSFKFNINNDVREAEPNTVPECGGVWCKHPCSIGFSGCQCKPSWDFCSFHSVSCTKFGITTTETYNSCQPSATQQTWGTGEKYVLMWVTDADKDGHFRETDCDDSDGTVYPGAPEVCDGQRNNCGWNEEKTECECSGPVEGDCEDYDNDDYCSAGMNVSLEYLMDNCPGGECCGTLDFYRELTGAENPSSGDAWSQIISEEDEYGKKRYSASVKIVKGEEHHFVTGSDCDDYNENVNPGEEEACHPDTFDNDCDDWDGKWDNKAQTGVNEGCEAQSVQDCGSLGGEWVGLKDPGAGDCCGEDGDGDNKPDIEENFTRWVKQVADNEKSACFRSEAFENLAVVDKSEKVLHYNGNFYGCNLDDAEDLKDFEYRFMLESEKRQITEKSSTEQGCDNVGDEEGGHYFCSQEGVWKTYNGLKAGNIKTTPFENDGLPGFSESECCPELWCWDGHECVDGSNPEGGQNTLRKCVRGEWEEIEEKPSQSNPNQRGQCAISQCYYLPESGDGMCVNEGNWTKDHYCNEGEWTTRTALLANELQGFAEDESDDYSIFCGAYDKVLNDLQAVEGEITFSIQTYLSNQQSNNFCALLYNDGSEKKVVIGASLNMPVNSEESEFLYLFEESRYQMGPVTYYNYCDGAIEEGESEGAGYFGCNYYNVKDNAKIWYNAKLDSIIYSSEEISLNGEESLIELFIGYIRSMIGGEEEAEEDAVPAKHFDRLYMNKKEGKLIKGFMDETRNKMRVEYSGVGSDICGYLNDVFAEELQGTNINCRRSLNSKGIPFYYIESNDENIAKDYWQDLTGKIRLNDKEYLEERDDLIESIGAERENKEVIGDQLSCSVKEACAPWELPLFSMYSLSDSHAGTQDYFGNNVCCGIEGLKPGMDCTAGAFVLTKFQPDDSHVSVTEGYYDHDVCLRVEGGSVSCRVDKSPSDGRCEEEEACVATLYQDDDSHIAACPDSTGDPYDNTVCCKYTKTWGE